MPVTLSKAWNDRVRAQPGAPALLDAAADRIWSRGELDALAAAWQARHGGEAAGGTVVFAEPNGSAWLEVFLGLVKSGAVAAPLDPTEPAGARRALAEAIGADFLWSGGRLEAIGRRRRRAR